MKNVWERSWSRERPTSIWIPIITTNSSRPIWISWASVRRRPNSIPAASHQRPKPRITINSILSSSRY